MNVWKERHDLEPSAPSPRTPGPQPRHPGVPPALGLYSSPDPEQLPEFSTAGRMHAHGERQLARWGGGGLTPQPQTAGPKVTIGSREARARWGRPTHQPGNRLTLQPSRQPVHLAGHTPLLTQPASPPSLSGFPSCGRGWGTGGGGRLWEAKPRWGRGQRALLGCCQALADKGPRREDESPAIVRQLCPGLGRP